MAMQFPFRISHALVLGSGLCHGWVVHVLRTLAVDNSRSTAFICTKYEVDSNRDAQVEGITATAPVLGLHLSSLRVNRPSDPISLTSLGCSIADRS
jgi:hypothetical protein